MSDPAAGPAPRAVAPERVVALDVARCLALLGMMATHVLASQAADGSSTLVHEIAGGRSSALFAVLAGITTSLASGRVEPLRGRPLLAAAAGLAARAVVVALIGLVLGALGTSIAVILTYYGVLFCLGLPFLGLRTRPLLLLAGAVAVVVPVVSHAVRPFLPDPTYVVPAPPSLADPGGLLLDLLLTGYYPALPWLSYLLLGMALGRLDLARSTAYRSTLGVAMVLGGVGAAVLATVVSGLLLTSRAGLAAELAADLEPPQERGTLAQSIDAGLYGVTPADGSWWWLATSGPHSATPFDLVHTAGSAVAVIGACLLLTRVAPRLWAVTLGAGTMTLTLYSLHLMLRVPGSLDEDGLPTYLVHVAVVLGTGALFALTGTRGPAEHAVARVSGGVRRAVAGHPEDRPRGAARWG